MEWHTSLLPSTPRERDRHTRIEKKMINNIVPIHDTVPIQIYIEKHMDIIDELLTMIPQPEGNVEVASKLT